MAETLTDLNALPLPELYAHLSESGLVSRLLRIARDEDLGPTGTDVTAAVTIAGAKPITAELVARDPGVVAGLAATNDVISIFCGDGESDRGGVEFEPAVEDGSRVAGNTLLGTLTGPASEIVTVERTLLNLIGRLSGIATRTAEFASEIEGTSVKLFDTRKTTPGLRSLEKYAVRCGGGHCHRLGLYDAVLIKDNHLAGVPLDQLANWLTDAGRRAFRLKVESGMALRFVEVEVDSLDQFDRVLTVSGGLIDVALLDNMSPDQLCDAVARRDRAGVELLLEASGGVSLDTIRTIANTGVDRISVGSLTHGAQSIDVGLDTEATG